MVTAKLRAFGKWSRGLGEYAFENIVKFKKL